MNGTNTFKKYNCQLELSLDTILALTTAHMLG